MTQPRLVHVHRWVQFETQYPHDSRMCLDCPAHERVPSEAADRLKELMDAVHQEPGHHRLRGRRGHGRLHAGPSGQLLATVNTSEAATRGTTETGSPRETRQFETVAEAARFLVALTRTYHRQGAEEPKVRGQ